MAKLCEAAVVLSFANELIASWECSRMPVDEPLLEERIVSIIAKILEISADELTTESAMGSTPGWDSLRNLKIIFELEKSFNLVFDLDDLVEVRSVTDCVWLVEKSMTVSGH